MRKLFPRWVLVTVSVLLALMVIAVSYNTVLAVRANDRANNVIRTNHQQITINTGLIARMQADEQATKISQAEQDVRLGALVQRAIKLAAQDQGALTRHKAYDNRTFARRRKR